MKEKYTLDAIAGYKAEKEELSKIIDVFRNYDKYKEAGTNLSKGLILSGDPGVGKTLFARVLASQINAPLIVLDGSKLIGLFGAIRIKRAFKKARKHTPSMIFIDELNLLAGDEYYQTDYTNRNLSALLRLIDGINENDGIFVVGASSDKDVLDDALLRSGRMDRHIRLGLPNSNSRKEIIELYINKLNLDASDINIKKMVSLTQGLTGADIKTIINEAALESVRNYCDSLDEEAIYSAITKIKNKDIVRRNAIPKSAVYHDIGHLVALYSLFNLSKGVYFNDYNYVGNSSIEFLDGFHKMMDLFDDEWDDDYDDDCDDEEEKETQLILLEKKDAMNLLTVRLAGMALEEVYFNNHSIISYVDLAKANDDIIYMMQSGFFGFEYVSLHNVDETTPLVGKIRDQIEDKKAELLKIAYEKAKQIIRENMDKIDRLMSLIEEEGEIEPSKTMIIMNSAKKSKK